MSPSHFFCCELFLVTLLSSVHFTAFVLLFVVHRDLLEQYIGKLLVLTVVLSKLSQTAIGLCTHYVTISNINIVLFVVLER